MFRGTIRENLEVPYFVEIASFNSILGTSNRYKVGCLSAYALVSGDTLRSVDNSPLLFIYTFAGCQKVKYCLFTTRM